MRFELVGAYLSAQRRIDEDLALIEFSIRKMETDLAAGSIAISDDIGFHIAIARCTHNFLRVPAAVLPGPGVAW